MRVAGATVRDVRARPTSPMVSPGVRPSARRSNWARRADTAWPSAVVESSSTGMAGRRTEMLPQPSQKASVPSSPRTSAAGFETAADDSLASAARGQPVALRRAARRPSRRGPPGPPGRPGFRQSPVPSPGTVIKHRRWLRGPNVTAQTQGGQAGEDDVVLASSLW